MLTLQADTPCHFSQSFSLSSLLFPIPFPPSPDFTLPFSFHNFSSYLCVSSPGPFLPSFPVSFCCLSPGLYGCLPSYDLEKEECRNLTDAASFSLLFGTSSSQDSLFVSQNAVWIKPRREMGWGWGQSGSCRRRGREAASSGQERALIPARRAAVFVHSGHPQRAPAPDRAVWPFPHLIPDPCDRTSPSRGFVKEEISHGFGFAGKVWKRTDTAPDIVRSLRNNNRPGAVEEGRYLSLGRFMTFGWNWERLFCRTHISGRVKAPVYLFCCEWGSPRGAGRSTWGWG